MKTSLTLVAMTAISSVCLSSTGLSQGFTTTLTRSRAVGFAPEQYVRSVKCEISPAGMQVTTHVGFSVTLVSNTPATQFEQERIDNLIQKASETPATVVGSAPYDIPVTFDTAQKSDGTLVTLNGLGSENGPVYLQNQSEEAKALVFMLDVLCGTL